MVDSRTRKFLLFLIPILCFVMIGVSVFANRKGNLDSTVSADEEILNDSSTQLPGVPRVISIDPKSAVEGKNFSYYLRIVDSDTPQESIIMSVKEAPDWLKADPSSFLLYGIPVYSNRDTEKVTLTITDGSHSIEHTFYLLITSQDE